MTETWKKIPGYPGYEASDLGRIRSYKGANQNSPLRKRPRLMKQRIPEDGYPRVTIQNEDGRKIVIQVHILIARTFLGPTNGHEVLHKDGRRSNRKLSNLYYGSHQRNMNDKYAHGTHGMGERNTQALLAEKERNQILQLKGKMTQQEIADKYGISRQAVSDIHRGVTWSHVHSHLKKLRKAWEQYLKNQMTNTLKKAYRLAEAGMKHQDPSVRQESRHAMKTISSEMRHKELL